MSREDSDQAGDSAGAGADPLSGLELSGPVLAALSRAVRLGPPVTTGRVLSLLSEVDTLGHWDRLWLSTGYPPGVGDAVDPDLPAQAKGTWRSVELNGALTRSLRWLARLAHQHDMNPVQPGALALAIVALPDNGAAVALLSSGELTHAELIELVQTELLGVHVLDAADLAEPTLDGASPVGASGDVWRSRASAVAGDRDPDDLDLLRVLLPEVEMPGVPSSPDVVETLSDLADDLRPLGTRSTTDVCEAASAEFDVSEPAAWQLLFALGAQPSAACHWLCRALGLSGPALAVEARLAQETGGPSRGSTSGRAATMSMVSLALLLAQLLLLVVRARATGDWWLLTLAVPTFWEPPAQPTWLAAAAAVPLYLFAGPVVGATQLFRVLVALLEIYLQRTRLWARTGIRMSMRSTMAFTRRRTAAGRRFAHHRVFYRGLWILFRTGFARPGKREPM